MDWFLREHLQQCAAAEREQLFLPGYERCRKIGEGGMGEVWEAWQVKLKRFVAIKVIRGGKLASAAEVRQFLAGAEAAATLRHDNIVSIHEVGEHEGVHYFTMDLMKGGSVLQNMPIFCSERERSVQLLETIARAVHFGHEHGILHRDLNPANILLDENDRPHIADFGIAIRLHRIGITEDGAVVGTPHYMSPEQAEGRTRDLTTKTDVYGLGAILYHLLTGRPPFEGETREEVLEQVVKSPPLDPRKIDPTIERGLVTICLKCLEKDPENRYPSAEALAVTIGRYLNGEAPEGVRVIQRAWHWARRNSVRAAAIAAAMVFVLIMVPGALSLLRGEKAAKTAEMQQDNKNRAAMVAGTVLAKFGALSEAVRNAAEDPRLGDALESGDASKAKEFCRSTYEEYEDPSRGLKLDDNSPFDMWFVMDETGRLLAVYARQPLMGTFLRTQNRNYEWRDYFRGAAKLAERRRHSTYISPAFKSENDDDYKFAISAPVYRNGTWVGVLIAAVAAQAKLGSLEDDTQSIAVLVAPRGRDRGSSTPESPYLVLRHPGYTSYGEAVGMDSKEVRSLNERSREERLRLMRPLGLPPPSLLMSNNSYRDPLAERYVNYAGRWIAGYAPVGNTGFVVIIQSRAERAFASVLEVGSQLAKRAGISASPGLLLMLAAVWQVRRKTRTRACRLA
jgi:eukaryotic-like serine/threonine-protein kinase